jgi:hypothetical protein
LRKEDTKAGKRETKVQRRENRDRKKKKTPQSSTVLLLSGHNIVKVIQE